MKGRNIYILCIVGFLLIVIVSQLMRPKPFSWVNTYGAHDKNPFGSYVSDSLLRQALPAGYSVKNLSWHQIKTDSAARRSNLLFTQSAFTPIEDCIDDLLEMVDSGMNVCIAANSFHYHLMDTLGFSVDWQSYSETSLRRMIQEKSFVDTIQWQKGGSFGKRNFIVNSGLLYSTTFAFDNNDKDPWKKEAILVGDEYGADDYYVVVDSVDKNP